MPIQNVSINAATPASPYKHVFQPQQNVVLNINRSSCTCNGDDVGLLMKTESIQKERTITQTAICNFLKCKGRGNIIKSDGVARMVVVLAHKEMSCLVAGIFDDLVGPISY